MGDMLIDRVDLPAEALMAIVTLNELLCPVQGDRKIGMVLPTITRLNSPCCGHVAIGDGRAYGVLASAAGGVLLFYEAYTCGNRKCKAQFGLVDVDVAVEVRTMSWHSMIR